MWGPSTRTQGRTMILGGQLGADSPPSAPKASSVVSTNEPQEARKADGEVWPTLTAPKEGKDRT